MVGAAGGVTPLGLWRSDDRLMRGGPLNILGLTQRPNGAIILRLIVAVASAACSVNMVNSVRFIRLYDKYGFDTSVNTV